MARRGRRDLSLEEKRLWEHVARHVTPLARPGIPIETPDSRMGHRAREQAGEKAAEKAGEGDMPKNRLRNDVSLPAMGRGGGAPTAPQSRPAKPEEKQRAHPRPSPARPALPAYHPPLSHKQNAAPSGPGGLDRKERRALRRRVREIEATLDLHGMRQEEAHRALIRFLQASSARDCAIVLVVTGKGGVSGPGFGDERGVLRRIVPQWLRAQELRPFVVGFEEAAAHHGGAGALYVRLRRRG